MFFSISTWLIIVTALVSYRGLKDHAFFVRFNFWIAPILKQKDYKRLFTSGFLHVSWTHLIFNMLALYFFSGSLENFLGVGQFLIIYTGSLLGGNLFSLYLHRHHESYAAAGASGAILGVIFASLALFPGMGIGLFFLPISIPGWLFGLGYVIFSIYGIRSRKDNIGHDAHLGGGLAGMFVGLIMHPEAFAQNFVTIAIISVPAVAFILLILYNPNALMVDNFYFNHNSEHLTMDDKYNLGKIARQKKLDSLLEKIHTDGMQSLSVKEKQFLKEYSK